MTDGPDKPTPPEHFFPPAPKAPPSQVAARLGKNLWLGLRVLGGEISWQALRALRAFKQRRLEKQLRLEYLNFGQSMADRLHGAKPGAALPAPDKETSQALQQIAFLRQEIAQANAERLQLREDFLADRRRALGMDKDA